jgi:hypothetical protein
MGSMTPNLTRLREAIEAERAERGTVEKRWLRTPPRNRPATMLKVEKCNHAATIEKPSRNHHATVPATMPRNRATVPYRGGDMVAPSLAPSRLSTPRLGFALAFGCARRALPQHCSPSSHHPQINTRHLNAPSPDAVTCVARTRAVPR